MKVEDIVEAFNKYIESTRINRNINGRGHVISQRSIERHPTFKSYKIHTVNIWFVKDTSKYYIASVGNTESLSTDKDIEESKLEVRVVQELFKVLDSKNFDLILSGKYGDV